MNCTVYGICCKSDVKVNKSGVSIPCVYVFSGDETVCISNIECNPDLVGRLISVDCEVKNREFEGRRYMTIKSANFDKGEVKK